MWLRCRIVPVREIGLPPEQSTNGPFLEEWWHASTAPVISLQLR